MIKFSFNITLYVYMNKFKNKKIKKLENKLKKKLTSRPNPALSPSYMGQVDMSK